MAPEFLPKNFSAARIGNVLPAAESWLLAALSQNEPHPLLVLTENEQQKQKLLLELPFFCRKDYPILEFSDWETLPYDRFSPHQDLVSQRLKLLHDLPEQKTGLIISSVHSLMNPLPPPEFLQQQVLLLQLGQTLDLTTKKSSLIEAGYHLVEQVLAPGEFATRGSIIDIFPMGAGSPFRIDLFGNQIDSIRSINLETQRSGKNFESIQILPAHEFSLDALAVKKFNQAWQNEFGSKFDASLVLKGINQGHAVNGLEYYLPLFFGQKIYSLFDYLPKSALIVRLPNLYPAAEKTWQAIEARYQEKTFDLDYPPLPKHKLFSSPDALFAYQKNWQHIDVETIALKKTSSSQKNLDSKTLPDISFKSTHKSPWEDLQQFIAAQQNTYNIILCAESSGRAEILAEHLQRMQLKYQRSDATLTELDLDTKPKGLIYLCLSHQAQGFIDPAAHLILITETEIFPQRPGQGRKTKTDPNTTFHSNLKDLSELNSNDLVVHITHGIGRYVGLSTLSLNDNPQEFLTLEYANQDRLYVPVHALHLLSRYGQGDAYKHALNSLGTDKWQKNIEKAAKRINDIAAQLLTLYAERMSKKGFACAPPNDEYHRFCDSFAFEATPDQQLAIAQVQSDMTAVRPMDRLLCGDVGFGKTEVAMRAAFLAVQSGKQVAILVPTTLLAEQHLENFSNRFANFGVILKLFSRSTSSKDETEILKALASGRVDIIIGTHKLLNPKLKFKDLGLIVIDEEHRFGVKDKEKLKAMRTDVDILTMTATPIPRTLNMSLSMLRDLSIIGTPPAKRLPVKTFVKEYNKGLVKEAILREVLRGGQVYYLHNNVATIYQKSEELQALIPNIKISTGHGQMRAHELERVMADFYHNRSQVLVCTTIIETGIDIPNANTIVLERADELGLAQLHQLRGRVGRSHHQAYAYLLTPPKAALTIDAIKRLDAIEQSSALGSGFTLASHDLDIRGAGEILGEDQSGQMQEIGVSLYLELLDRAVAAFKQGKILDTKALFLPDEIEVELNIPRLFPEDYISDLHLRLKFYQRLLQTKNLSELEDFKVELIDRFGMLPIPAEHLLACQALKFQAKSLGIKKIEAHKEGSKIQFADEIHFDPLKLIRLVQNGTGQLQLRGEKLLLGKCVLLDAATRINHIKNILAQLA